MRMTKWRRPSKRPSRKIIIITIPPWMQFRIRAISIRKTDGSLNLIRSCRIYWTRKRSRTRRKRRNRPLSPSSPGQRPQRPSRWPSSPPWDSALSLWMLRALADYGAVSGSRTPSSWPLMTEWTASMGFFRPPTRTGTKIVPMSPFDDGRSIYLFKIDFTPIIHKLLSNLFNNFDQIGLLFPK